MLHIHYFTFNPFQENTYILWDETQSAVVIDPGCYTKEERETLTNFISEKGLSIKKVLNTHGHIDHVLGNDFVMKHYKVGLATHKMVEQEIAVVPSYAQMYGFEMEMCAAPDLYLAEGDIFTFGNTNLEILFTPGHSAGHISFFHRESKQLFSGDVLFQGSIGRTDLPGGNYKTLIESIVTKLLPLGDEVRVYAGHMLPTTIGEEKRFNPFLN